MGDIGYPALKLDKPAGYARPSYLVMQDSAGVGYVLWFDTSGNLHTTTQALAEADGYDWTSGTHVGAQT